MKAKQTKKDTIVLLDGVYQYSIRRTGKGETDFDVRKAKIESDDLFDLLMSEEQEEELDK